MYLIYAVSTEVGLIKSYGSFVLILRINPDLYKNQGLYETD